MTSEIVLSRPTLPGRWWWLDLTGKVSIVEVVPREGSGFLVLRKNGVPVPVEDWPEGTWAPSPGRFGPKFGTKREERVREESERKRTQEDKRKRWFQFEGRQLSLTEISQETGIGVATISNRLRRGWTIEEAVMPVGRGRGLRRFRGKLLPVAEIARMTGMGKSTIHRRLRRGWTIEEAVKPFDRRKRRIVFKERLLSVNEIAQETGIDADIISIRLCRGDSITRAVRPVRPRRKRKSRRRARR